MANFRAVVQDLSEDIVAYPDTAKDEKRPGIYFDLADHDVLAGLNARSQLRLLIHELFHLKRRLELGHHLNEDDLQREEAEFLRDYPGLMSLDQVAENIRAVKQVSVARQSPKRVTEKSAWSWRQSQHHRRREKPKKDFYAKIDPDNASQMIGAYWRHMANVNFSSPVASRHIETILNLFAPHGYEAIVGNADEILDGAEAHLRILYRDHPEVVQPIVEELIKPVLDNLRQHGGKRGRASHASGARWA